VLLHHYIGEVAGHYRSWGFRSAAGAVSQAIAAAACEAGAQIRTGAAVARILYRGGEPRASCSLMAKKWTPNSVLSTVDPRLDPSPAALTRETCPPTPGRHRAVQVSRLVGESEPWRSMRFRFSRACPARVRISPDAISICRAWTT
jgi:phytoene dehydrogenase-like protein